MLWFFLNQLKKFIDINNTKAVINNEIIVGENSWQSDYLKQIYLKIQN